MDNSDTSREDIKVSALEYAASGWYVIPCSRAKQPLTPHGHLDASINQGVVSGYWNRFPGALIGVACKPSGFVVIDIDYRNGGGETFAKLVAEHGEFPKTCAALTGIQDGGRGMHLYFKAPPGGIELKGSLGPGVDVKQNGYVIVPPSPHPSGVAYEWIDTSEMAELPGWILDKFAKPVRYESQRASSRYTSRGDSICGVLGLRVEEFLLPLQARIRDGQIEGTHPVHGSTTGTNLAIDPTKNVWYCRRCGSGGGPLEALAVAEGIIACHEAEPGCLSTHWSEIFRALRNRGYDTDRINEHLPGMADVKALVEALKNGRR